MTVYRLDSNQPQLARAFRHASDAKRREAALIACEYAISATNVSGPVIAVALEALRSGNIPQPDVRADLETAVERLDEDYFRLDQQTPDVDDAKVLRVFSMARATSALAFALSPDAGDLHEAIYEAIESVGDPREIVHALETALR